MIRMHPPLSNAIIPWYQVYYFCTSYMRGPRARALSTHLPVITTSAPSSSARAMGAALFQQQSYSEFWHPTKSVPLSLIPDSHQLNTFNQTRFNKIKMSNGRLKDFILRRVHVSSNVCLHFVEFGVYIMSGSNLYQENNFKPCLTKQLLNMFKLGVNAV